MFGKLEQQLFHHVKTGSIKKVKYMVRLGADLKAKDDNGCSVLMFANNVDDIRYLILKGADVKQKDFYGRTALTYAKNAECVKEFVRLGIEFLR